MNTRIKNRALKLADYIIETKEPVRTAARRFGFSKSTVHYDVSIRLKDINFIKFLQVKSILFKNFNDKHNRGGKATATKFENK